MFFLKINFKQKNKNLCTIKRNYSQLYTVFQPAEKEKKQNVISKLTQKYNFIIFCFY